MVLGNRFVDVSTKDCNKVQRALFKLGYGWPADGKKCIKCRTIFIDTSKNLYIAVYNPNDYDKITVSELLGEEDEELWY